MSSPGDDQVGDAGQGGTPSGIGGRAGDHDRALSCLREEGGGEVEVERSADDGDGRRLGLATGSASGPRRRRTGAPARSPRPAPWPRPTRITSATPRRAENIALSAGPPSPPERPWTAMAPSSEAIMFTSTHGRSTRSRVGPRRPRARRRRPPRPASGHNRCMDANLLVAGWGRWPRPLPCPATICPPTTTTTSSRTSPIGPGGSAPPCSAPTTGSCRPRRSSWAWRAAASSLAAVRIAGIAGLVAGAMSMAAGEYVSVASQRDTEEADLRMEAQALRDHPRAELQELAQIWQSRGLDAGPRPGGGAPAHGGRCPGRARARRARAHGGLHGAARAGGVDVGGVLRARRGHPAARLPGGAERGARR